MKSFYYPLCNTGEVERIFDVKSSDDYLLKLRADTALVHMRIYRVIRSKMLRMGDKWNFEEYFNDSPFNNYIRHLADEDITEAENLTAGFVFCNKPNGRIMKTDFGNVITISESLRYFLYFMNLAFLDFEESTVPQNVKSAAIKIAIRTMLQSESLDFDIDPRGEIPEGIHDSAQYHTDRQLEFLAGHEYAHHLLGHLNNNNLIDGQFLSAIDSDDFVHKFFSYAQQEELDADLNALERPVYTPDMKVDMVTRALFFFVYLDIYQSVKDQIMPSFGGAQSHPTPMDRFNYLHQFYKNKIDLDEDNLEILLNNAKMIKESLTEDVAYNIDSYEFYGSIYLGEWRGKVLIDRVDF